MSRTDLTPTVTRKQFRFEFARSYRVPAWAFGIHDATALVTVTDTGFHARFGPWQVTTPLANIASTEFTGPFAYPKTAGPAHLTFSNRGLTFASTGRQGLLLRFHEPVRGLDPWGRLRHPDLTVTVQDPAALAAAVAGRSGS